MQVNSLIVKGLHLTGKKSRLCFWAMPIQQQLQPFPLCWVIISGFYKDHLLESNVLRACPAPPNTVTKQTTTRGQTFPMQPNKQKGVLVTGSCHKSSPDSRCTCKEMAESQALFSILKVNNQPLVWLVGRVLQPFPKSNRLFATKGALLITLDSNSVPGTDTVLV